MRSTQSNILSIALSALTLLGLLCANQTSAQDPDIRDIPGVVMLLVDTSGSMERSPECICTTEACTECLPDCVSGEKNRWSLVLESLTGEWSSFSCTSEDRSGANPKYSGAYDEGYPIPHQSLPHELVTPPSQSSTGILDVYADQVKFGLMTLDGLDNFTDASGPVLQSVFETEPNLSDNALARGMFSYGDRKPFKYPAGGGFTYMIDNGARNKNATEGRLVSVGADGDQSTTAQTIQDVLLGQNGEGALRPFFAEPTAALLDDLNYYLNNDDDVIEKTSASGPGDAYYDCRPRSAILITDGFPNADMRGHPFFCEALGQPVGSEGCPYDTHANIVADMIANELIEKLYVIGFDLVGDQDEIDEVEGFLNDLASIGNTGSAVFVDTREELLEALTDAISTAQPASTTRTRPIITGADPGLPQHEFLSGFTSTSAAADPWSGTLERRRFACVDGVPSAQEIDDADRFQVQLNQQSSAPTGVTVFSGNSSISFPVGSRSRNLWTALPSSSTEIADRLAGDGQDQILETGLNAPTDAGTIHRDTPPAAITETMDRSYFNVATDAERDTVVDFLHGEVGTAREDKRLGAIYHSTPVIVGPLSKDIDDPTYNAFRRGSHRTRHGDTAGWDLSQRPRVLYAASNDGIIHAFLTDDYSTGLPTAFDCANGKSAGTELWGFVPTMLLDDLKDLPSGHQWMTDGNLVVKDVYDARARFAVSVSGGIDPTTAEVGTGHWRTILTMGLRNGGAGAIALDVTNPCEPEFLWQFTDSGSLGDTLGDPTISQIAMSASGFSRGVVIIPGGEGTLAAPSSPCTATGDALPSSMDSPTGTPIVPRSDRRCWNTQGRFVYVIDSASGTILKEFDSTIFTAPMTGGVSVFNGNIGELARSAYLSDEDGVLWRLNFDDLDIADWEAVAFHDMFYDGAVTDGQPGYNPPVITIDFSGDVVILHGTGNIDDLTSTTANNRVVSLTEELSFDSFGNGTLGGSINWDIALSGGEQVVGPLDLFSERVFFGTFVPASDPVNACVIGGSKLWGVSFLDDPAVPGDLVPKIQLDESTVVTFLDKDDIPELEDTLLTGVQVVPEVRCVDLGSEDVDDPFTGSTQSVAIPTPQNEQSFRLLTQLSGGALGEGGASTIDLEQNLSGMTPKTQIIGIADLFE